MGTEKEQMNVHGFIARPDSHIQPDPPEAIGGMVVEPNTTPFAALSNLTMSASILPLNA